MNGRSAGGAFPESANAAYVIAKDWKSASVRAADSRGVIANGAAFMLADDVRALNVDPVPTPSAIRPTIVTPTRKPSIGAPARGNARSTMRPNVRFSSPPMMRAAAAFRALALELSRVLQLQRGWTPFCAVPTSHSCCRWRRRR
jgi:hypothetical protein